MKKDMEPQREPIIEPFVEINARELIDKKDVAESRKTNSQMAKEISLYILKNPKVILEWMLVLLIGRLVFNGELTFEIIKKFLK